MKKEEEEKPTVNEFSIVENIVKYRHFLEENNKRGLALDIDETLSFTLCYWHKQLSLKYGNPENLSIEEIYDKYGYFQNYPHWQSNPEALKWMKEAINNNQLHEEFPLIEGAEDGVKKISELKKIVLYPTTRPRTVAQGTLNWLKKYKFPPAGLLARPINVHPEDAYKWKAQILDSMYPFVEGIIDDHPKVALNLPKNYKGTVYLYNQTESPRPDLNIIPCKTWVDVLSEIKNQEQVF